MKLADFLAKCQPTARPESVIRGQNYRITVLTPSLIRFEYSKIGVFEDRPTQSVVNRFFDPVEFSVKEKDGRLLVRTENLAVTYDRKEFTPQGLEIKVTNIGTHGWGATWRYGDKPRSLGGTARTLDEANGPVDPAKIVDGVMSRDGFGLIDDSRSMVIASGEEPPAGVRAEAPEVTGAAEPAAAESETIPAGWVLPRPADTVDFYFFGYGHRYLECLKDFYHLTGHQPLLPRFAFGNWWSRYHRYTDEEYRTLVRRFDEEGIPFTVAVVDMDWHLVDDVDPKYGSGWTGYTWNRSFFPDPKDFMAWLHEQGLKITLNLHPADGIRAYEECYPRLAEALAAKGAQAVDTEAEEGIGFDVTDPVFMETYFDEVLHPMEDDGVDFWWIDWQQGTTSRMPGLDPLWILNHCHYLDSCERLGKGLTFSRFAGVGSHRYPVGFSGDTVISWESLEYQPYFTSTASNVGYGWWSHDIGGHMQGIRDDELAARWVELGVFSPINRLHSTDNPFNGKEPWRFAPEARGVMTRYLRLRHELIPYLYSMNYRAAEEDIPLVLPMYYVAPERDEAYHVPAEYCFGSELVAAAVTSPRGRASLMSGVDVFLPEGSWADFMTGAVYDGGRMLRMYRPLDQIPVLMKPGAIVPLDGDIHARANEITNPKTVHIVTFPAGVNSFVLWEDCGEKDAVPGEDSAGFDKCSGERICRTMLENTGEALLIHPADGAEGVIPATRSWNVEFVGSDVQPGEITVTVNGEPEGFSSGETERGIFVRVNDVSVGCEIRISAGRNFTPAKNDAAGRCFAILERAQMSYDIKARAYKLIEAKGSGALAEVFRLGLPEDVYGALAEIIQAQVVRP